MSNEPQKYKVQVAAKLHEDCRYYRRAGLVLHASQEPHEVTAEQLLALRADPSVVVVGGPETLAIAPPPPVALKPTEQAAAEAVLKASAEKLQLMGEALAAAQKRNEELEAKQGVLDARLAKLEQAANDKPPRK